MTKTIKGVLVLEADKEEMHKGWVRISEKKRCGIKSSSYVKLSYCKKSVFTQVRGNLRGENGILNISEWYRDFLGLKDDPSEKVDLKLSDQRQVFYWLRALMSHPDDAIRLSIGLATISIALGVLGVGLAIGLSVSPPVVSCSIIGFFSVVALVAGCFGVKIVKGPARPTNSS